MSKVIELLLCSKDSCRSILSVLDKFKGTCFNFSLVCNRLIDIVHFLYDCKTLLIYFFSFVTFFDQFPRPYTQFLICITSLRLTSSISCQDSVRIL